MPPYNGGGSGSLVPNAVPPAVLYPGDEKYLFGTTPYVPGTIPTPNDSNVVQEAVTVGESSIAVTLATRQSGGSPAVMVQVTASGNPGVCEIDVQDAGIDADGAYLLPTGSSAYKITTWTATASGNYVGYTELSPEVGRFIRLNVVSNPNSVKFAAKIIYV